MHDAARYLPFHDLRVDDHSGVVHHDISLDFDRTGLPVDCDLDRVAARGARAATRMPDLRDV